LGSVLTLLNGAWAVFVAYYAGNAALPCSNCIEMPLLPGTVVFSELQGALFFVGAVLALDSVISFAGLRVAFLFGAFLSVVVFALVALQWGALVSADSVAALVLSVGTLLVDAVASRPAKALSERDSPLNLPVFG
jgi:hypothetical protein